MVLTSAPSERSNAYDRGACAECAARSEATTHANVRATCLALAAYWMGVEVHRILQRRQQRALLPRARDAQRHVRPRAVRERRRHIRQELAPPAQQRQPCNGRSATMLRSVTGGQQLCVLLVWGLHVGRRPSSMSTPTPSTSFATHGSRAGSHHAECSSPGTYLYAEGMNARCG